MSLPLLNGIEPRPPEPLVRVFPPGEAVDVVYFWRGAVYERPVDIDKLIAGAELDSLVNERVLERGPGRAPLFSVSPAAIG